MKQLKMAIKKSIFGFTAISLLTVALFSACKKTNDSDPTDLGSQVYTLSVYPQGAEEMVLGLTSSLTSGQESVANAYEGYNFVDPKTIDNALYSSDRDAKLYRKFKMSNGKLVIEKEIPIVNGFTILEFGHDKFLSYLGGDEFAYTGVIGFDVIDKASFSVTRSGQFDLPRPPSDDFIYYVGGVYIHNEKIYITYELVKSDWSSAIETAYVAIYNASSFAFESVISDNRTKGLGCKEDTKIYAADNGDIYFVNGRQFPLGTNCVLRIKNGESNFDQSYFFNLTNTFGHEMYTYQTHDLGGGKAIMLTYDPNITTDYYYEYWLIDAPGKICTKLNVPPSTDIDYRYMLDIPGNKVALISNTSTGSFIYIYDKDTGTVSKGLEYTGGLIYDISGPLTE